MASVAELKKSFFAEIDKVENREDSELNKFFRERTHVEAMKICRSVFLPKVRTSVRAPKKAELIAFTRLLQKGSRLNEPIWVLTASGDAKPSNQVFMGTAYSPVEDWQKNASYSPQMDFLSSEYLDGVPPEEVAGWKDFLYWS